MINCFHIPSMSTMLIIAIIQLLLKGTICQFQQIQSIPNPDQQSQTFAASSDFKYISLHSNNYNTLYIYECNHPQFNQNLIFEQKQQVMLDTQIYSILKISTVTSGIYTKNLILMGAPSSNTVKIFTKNASTNKFVINQTLRLQQQGTLSAVSAHSLTEGVYILGFKGQVVIINIGNSKSMKSNQNQDIDSDDSIYQKISDNIGYSQMLSTKYDQQQYQVMQRIDIVDTKINTICMSNDGVFLAFGGDNLQINIYQYDKQTKQFKSLNAFFQGQQVRQLRFSSQVRYTQFTYTLIARLKQKIVIYVYHENLMVFQQFKTINSHYGFINDWLNLIIESHPEQDIGIAKLFKQDSNSSLFQQRQALEVLLMKTAYFQQSRSNLIVLGSNFIRTYRYCDIDHCQNCQLIENTSKNKSVNSLTIYQKSIDYICIKCSAGYQQKQGMKCIKCNQYPTICHNCQLQNKCTKCAQGFTLGLQHFCIPCHIKNCSSCHESQVCNKCEQDYELNSSQNSCALKNNHISLTGIIIGTIIGASIIIFVAVYVLYNKSQNKQKNKSAVAADKNKNSIKNRKYMSRGGPKQSLLNSNTNFVSVYEDYEDSSDTEQSIDNSLK